MSDAFLRYVSPHKLARSASRPDVRGGVKKSRRLKGPQLWRKSMSYFERVQDWDLDVTSSPPGEKHKQAADAPVDSHGKPVEVVKTVEHPSDDIDGTTFVDDLYGGEEDMDEDMDGTTVHEDYNPYDHRDVAATVGVTDSDHFIIHDDDSADDEIIVGGRSSDVSDSDSDAVDDTLLEPDETEIGTREKPLDVILEPQQKKHAEGAYISRKQLLDNNWPHDCANLIQKLHQRGYEPLFPPHWQMDFKFLPDELFDPRDLHTWFNAAKRAQDFHATKALHRLLQLGPRIRDKVVCRLRPDKLVKKEIETYLHWARRDADIPVLQDDILVIETGPADADINTLEQNLLNRLLARYTYFRELLPPDQYVPTLFGVIVSHTLVGIVSYRPPWQTDLDDAVTPSKRWFRATTPGARGSLRSVGVFDFGQQGYDVWNAIALGMLVIQCRNIAIRIEDMMNPLDAITSESEDG